MRLVHTEFHMTVRCLEHPSIHWGQQVADITTDNQVIVCDYPKLVHTQLFASGGVLWCIPVNVREGAFLAYTESHWLVWCSSMSDSKQPCTLTHTEVIVSAHLMSIQINDGSPGDGFHSLKQELGDEWKNVFFLWRWHIHSLHSR